jgi:hypothetical protein
MLGEGGVNTVEVTLSSKEENSKTFVPITSKNSASGLYMSKIESTYTGWLPHQ